MVSEVSWQVPSRPAISLASVTSVAQHTGWWATAFIPRPFARPLTGPSGPRFIPVTSSRHHPLPSWSTASVLTLGQTFLSLPVLTRNVQTFLLATPGPRRAPLLLGSALCSLGIAALSRPAIVSHPPRGDRPPRCWPRLLTHVQGVTVASVGEEHRSRECRVR